MAKLNFDALRQEVERDTTIDGSANTLIAKLLEAVEDNKNDPAELQAIVDEFRTRNDEQLAAILANTPAEPTE